MKYLVVVWMLSGGHWQVKSLSEVPECNVTGTVGQVPYRELIAGSKDGQLASTCETVWPPAEPPKE